MTYIYESDLYSLKVYMQTKYQLSISSFSKVITLQTDRHIMQTDATYFAESNIKLCQRIHT